MQATGGLLLTAIAPESQFENKAQAAKLENSIAENAPSKQRPTTI